LEKFILALLNPTNILFKLTSFLGFLLAAQTRDRIKHNGLRALLVNVFKYDFNNQIFADAEQIRESLLNNNAEFKRTDFGAGKNINSSKKQKIKSVAVNSLSSQAQSLFLYNLACQTKSMKILELGSSFGINAVYLSRANAGSKLITLEGDPFIANWAVKIFTQLKMENITLIKGDFKDTLSGTIERSAPFDMIFIDGNHTFEATVSYFNRLIPHLAENGVMVFDDIRWNKQMFRAWKEIATDPQAGTAIDLFKTGILLNTFYDKKCHKVLPPFNYLINW
jgi:predicted O-methyltransferase YrrM